MPTFIPVDGTNFGASAAAPATYDDPGFSALTFTEVDACEIIDISGYDNTWDTIEDNSLCPEGGPPRKAKRTLGQFTLTIKHDKANPIHALLRTAEASQTDVISCLILFPDGADKDYFQAQVMAYNLIYGSSGADQTYSLVLQPQALPVEVRA